MKSIILFAALSLCACANQSTCGDTPDARTVYFKNSCRRRIREVVVGSELNIPQNIKNDALSNFTLQWIDPSVDGGKLTFGHYDLVPPSDDVNTDPAKHGGSL